MLEHACMRKHIAMVRATQVMSRERESAECEYLMQMRESGGRSIWLL